MDSPKINEKKGAITVHRAFFRSLFAVVSSLLIFLLISFSLMYVAVFIGNLSVWSPISVHSRCRVVSSSVDLRSSKVCELGLLNYRAKHVFYPYERKKYRCHYDYYWASVFQVEYVDHSGQVRFGLAEAPNEALPYNCRPSFGAAWLTKDKFKVNGTYECWYTLGIPKVNINHKGLFDCRAEYPSTAEMIKRYYILFSRILRSGVFVWEPNEWRWDVVVGAITGFITALITSAVIGLLRPLMCYVRGLVASWKVVVLVKRGCFLVAYFSLMSWVSFQYLKRLGLA